MSKGSSTSAAKFVRIALLAVIVIAVALGRGSIFESGAGTSSGTSTQSGADTHSETRPGGGAAAGTETADGASTGDQAVRDLFTARRSDEVVVVTARVDRLLPDDNEGSRHQRFIIRLGSGHTLLVAHNIDLADRVPLQAGDEVRIRGEYEWNEQGGVLHWTHHDPQGRRPGGWIDFEGQRYR